MSQKNLFFSIIISTYNGENSIENAIKSLLSQNFPKNQYEIIVVDDGSTDKTGKLVKKYPVKYLKHKNNLGLSAARNTGLKAARGDIYICFDDDCEADEDWLKYLFKIYQTNKDISGVGGKIINKKTNIMFNNYLYEINYGNISEHTIVSDNLFIRLQNYLKSNLQDTHCSDKTYKTKELMGGNSSFPIKILNAVGGWDPDFSGVEDTELCRRIRNQFPHKPFYITQKSKLIHNHKLNFWKFLKTQYTRGPVRYRYFNKYNLIPPIFPFPIMYFLLSLILLYFSTPALIFILLGPEFLYFKWVIKSIKYKKAEYLLFPYIQLAYETVYLFGILKGVFSK